MKWLKYGQRPKIACRYKLVVYVYFSKCLSPFIALYMYVHLWVILQCVHMIQPHNHNKYIHDVHMYNYLAE